MSADCPRCWGPLDLTNTARSRATADRSIDICPTCGSDEACRQHAATEMVPPHEWPIINGAHDYALGMPS